jgi:hypothetical protein
LPWNATFPCILSISYRIIRLRFGISLSHFAHSLTPRSLPRSHSTTMGGAASPPFLYDPPSRWSFNDSMTASFNPKAVTEQSRVPQPPRHQPNGPLVGFNRHPDSVSSA